MLMGGLFLLLKLDLALSLAGFLLWLTGLHESLHVLVLKQKKYPILGLSLDFLGVRIMLPRIKGEDVPLIGLSSLLTVPIVFPLSIFYNLVAATILTVFAFSGCLCDIHWVRRGKKCRPSGSFGVGPKGGEAKK